MEAEQRIKPQTQQWIMVHFVVIYFYCTVLRVSMEKTPYFYVVLLQHNGDMWL